jgi:small conductance mechanosensitive channel
MEEFINKLIEQAAVYAPKVLGAIATLIIGLIIINTITSMVGKLMKRQNVDPSLAPFLKSLLNALLKVLLVISVASILGIEMTSFVAVLGAAGLAVGMALSGTLQNFAGGVMILLFKPFKVGDLVEAQGFKGVVKEIQIFTTTIASPAGRRNIVANSALANGSVTNFTHDGQVCVEWEFGIGYGDSTAKAKEVLMQLIDEDERILRGEAAIAEPTVAVSALADSSVNFTVRVWSTVGDYWDIYFDMYEKVYNRFNETGLNIPFPQMDVHLHQTER